MLKGNNRSIEFVTLQPVIITLGVCTLLLNVDCKVINVNNNTFDILQILMRHFENGVWEYMPIQVWCMGIYANPGRPDIGISQMAKFPTFS